MGLLDGLNKDPYYGGEALQGTSPITYKKRSFKEEIQDKIAYHQAKAADLQAVLDSLSPDVLKFVEALQKING